MLLIFYFVNSKRTLFLIFVSLAEELSKKTDSESVLALLRAAVSEIERETDVSFHADST